MLNASLQHDETLIGDDGELVVPLIVEPDQNSIYADLPDLFLVDTKHEEFIIGRKIQPNRRMLNLRPIWAILLLTLPLIGAATIIIRSDMQQLQPIGLISSIAAYYIPIIIIICIIARLFLSTPDDVLYSNGILIRGHVTFYRRRKHTHDLIYYQFVTPTGRELTVHDKIVRKLQTSWANTSNGATPETGTPVAVLYLNDNFYKLL